MPGTGLEPARPCDRQTLKYPCPKPFPRLRICSCRHFSGNGSDSLSRLSITRFEAVRKERWACQPAVAHSRTSPPRTSQPLGEPTWRRQGRARQAQRRAKERVGSLVQLTLGIAAKIGCMAQYPVVLRPGEDGWVVAECPILPGCISQGRTREEALVNIREAIELCLESREAEGWEAPHEFEVTEVAVG